MGKKNNQPSYPWKQSHMNMQKLVAVDFRGATFSCYQAGSVHVNVFASTLCFCVFLGTFVALFVSIKAQWLWRTGGEWPVPEEICGPVSHCQTACMILNFICSAFCTPSTPATLKYKTREDLSTCCDHVWECCVTVVQKCKSGVVGRRLVCL